MKSSRRFGGSARLPALLMTAALAACGGSGGSSSSGDPSTNSNPSANAGEDQVVDAGSTVAFAGSGADSDGTITHFAWKQLEGPAVTLDGADSGDAQFVAPEVDSVTTLTFELTVTDNDGATASDTLNVDVAPVFALSGRAYDGPIANAVITVTIGDRTYAATADSDGVYTVNVAAIDPNAIVTIRATGPVGYEHIELLSIAGSFGALQAAAGDDGVLEAAESGNVNVTNISTAKAVLMIEANGGEGITDPETFTQMEGNVSGDDLMYLATVIKLVIDGGFTLPEGTDSTLALASNREVATTFVEAVDAADPAAFENVYNDIVNDPALMTAFTAANTPAQLFTLYVSSVQDTSLTYRVINRGKSWTFGADSRGTRSDGDYASMGFDWAITNGKIVVNYDEPLSGNGYCTHPDAPVELSEYAFYCESNTTATAITLLHDGAVADTLLLSNTGVTNYPNVGDPNYPAEGLEPVPMDGGSNNLGFAAAAVFPFDAAEVPGRWITTVTGMMPMEVAAVATSLLDSGFMEFEADGTGQRMATDHALAEVFSWTVKGGALEVTYSSGDVVRYYRMRRDGGVYDTLALVTIAEGQHHSEAGLMLEVEVDRLPLLELEDIPARYALFEMENDFSIRFAMDGTGSEEFYDAEGPYDTYPFSWALREDYVVEMAYYWDEIVGDTAECVDAASCEIYKHRLWYPAAYDDATGRVYLLEIQQRYFWDPEAEYHMGELRYYQPSVRYWGRTEFADEFASFKRAAPSVKPAANRMSAIMGTPPINTR